MADLPRSRSLRWCGLIRAFRLGVIAALSLWACPAAAAGPQEEPQAILLIHSYGHDSPGRFVFDTGFSQALREATDLETELYIESLDGSRFRSLSQMRLTREYLRARYANKKLAVVVTVYDRALAFLLDNDEPLFPGVPVAAVLTGDPVSLPNHVSAIWSGVTYGESVAVALALLPGTRQIALIDGAPKPNSTVYEQALKQVTAAAKGRPIISLRDLPLDVLLSQVRGLPVDTVAIIVRQLIGRHGEVTTNAKRQPKSFRQLRCLYSSARISSSARERSAESSSTWTAKRGSLLSSPSVLRGILRPIVPLPWAHLCPCLTGGP